MEWFTNERSFDDYCNERMNAPKKPRSVRTRLHEKYRADGRRNVAEIAAINTAGIAADFWYEMPEDMAIDGTPEIAVEVDAALVDDILIALSLTIATEYDDSWYAVFWKFGGMIQHDDCADDSFYDA